jgi:hypothetical protein
MEDKIFEALKALGLVLLGVLGWVWKDALTAQRKGQEALALRVASLEAHFVTKEDLREITKEIDTVRTQMSRQHLEILNRLLDDKGPA